MGSKRYTLKFKHFTADTWYYTKWDGVDNGDLIADIEIHRVEDWTVYPYKRFGYNIIFHNYKHNILSTDSAFTLYEAKYKATFIWVDNIGTPNYLKD